MRQGALIDEKSSCIDDKRSKCDGVKTTEKHPKSIRLVGNVCAMQHPAIFRIDVTVGLNPRFDNIDRQHRHPRDSPYIRKMTRVDQFLDDLHFFFVFDTGYTAGNQS